MLSKKYRRSIATKISARRVVLTSLAVDFLDIALNLGIALITGSVVMLAEALQGSADLAASAFLLIGLVRSERPPDTDSPFGYGREIYFWTLLAGLLMVSVTASLSLYFGWRRIVFPEQILHVGLAYLVLGVAIVSNGYSLALSIRRILGRASIWNLVPAFLRSTLVETKTTFILDLMGTLSALLGFLFLVLFGATQNARFDGIGAVVIGVMIAVLAIVLLVGVQDLLVGRSALPEIETEIRQATLAHPQVTEVLGVKTMHIGTDRLLVALDAHFAHGLSTQQIEQAIDEIKASVREKVPSVRHIQVELETPPAELHHS